MAAKECDSFEVKFKSDLDDAVFAEVVKKSKAEGLIIKGDPKKGTLKHTKYKFVGKYTIKGKVIKFEIVEDMTGPWCGKIEKDITKAMKGM